MKKASVSELARYRMLQIQPDVCGSCRKQGLCWHHVNVAYVLETILNVCPHKDVKEAVETMEKMRQGKPLGYYSVTAKTLGKVQDLTARLVEASHPHRSFLLEKIGKFSPHSLLEIGCGYGSNLYNVAKKFPKAELRGIDINLERVQKGNEWFRQEAVSNVTLEVGKAQQLEEFGDKSFDVVLTDALLIYIAPNEIVDIIGEMLRIGRVVIMNEWHVFNKWLALLLHTIYYFKLRSTSFKPMLASLGFFVGHWARDYQALLEQFVPKEKVRVTRLPKSLWNDKGWRRWGAIVEAAQ